MLNTSQIDSLIEAGRKIVEKGMVWGSAGNLSVRAQEGQILITASGSSLGSLIPEDVVLCGLDGSFDGRKPSKELPLHTAIYQSCPKAGAVIHATPFYATMAACSTAALKTNLFVEAIYYLEHMASIPFYNPGSQALAQAVARVCAHSNIILMKNHGVLLFEKSMEEALAALEVLETVCRMNLSCPSGVSLVEPSKEQIVDFLERSGYKPRNSLFDS